MKPILFNTDMGRAILEGLVDPVGVQFIGQYKNDRWYRRVVKGEMV